MRYYIFPLAKHIFLPLQQKKNPPRHPRSFFSSKAGALAGTPTKNTHSLRPSRTLQKCSMKPNSFTIFLFFVFFFLFFFCFLCAVLLSAEAWPHNRRNCRQVISKYYEHTQKFLGCFPVKKGSAFNLCHCSTSSSDPARPTKTMAGRNVFSKKLYN